MRIAIATLESVAPYSQSRYHNVPKIDKEGADEYEQRTWRDRCHFDDEGRLFIPPMSFKMALATAARFLSIKIKGRGQATYTKHFESGVLVLEGLPLNVTKDQVAGETFPMNSDGRRGSGSRVFRTYPVVPSWSGDVTYHILDDTITKDVFETVLRESGKFIGIGRFRPENGGFNGRYDVKKVVWKEQ